MKMKKPFRKRENIAAVIAFSGISSYVEVDSELMSAYKGETLCNDKILFTRFPELEPGENMIQVSTGISKVEIIPRWRTI